MTKPVDQIEKQAELVTQLKISKAKSVIKAAIKANRPFFLWGSPGVGKTSAVQQVVDDLNVEVNKYNAEPCNKDKPQRKWELVVVRAVLLDPTDLRGIPSIETLPNGKKVCLWVPPQFIPTDPDWRGVIFLDELPQAAVMSQSACLQLLDRMVGDYKISPNARIGAAGNRSTDRAGASNLITPLLNRFAAHIEVRHDAEDWLDWAYNNDICGEIVTWINYKKDALNKFNPTANEKAFPTPRSWEMLSDMLKVFPKDGNTTPEEWKNISTAAIGGAASIEFFTYLKIYRELPTIEQIIAGKCNLEEVKKSYDGMGVQWAIAGLVYDFAKESNEKLKAIDKAEGNQSDKYKEVLTKIGKVFNYVNTQFDAEPKTACARMVLQNDNITGFLSRTSQLKEILALAKCLSEFLVSKKQ
jgi:hypothetical protein